MVEPEISSLQYWRFKCLLFEPRKRKRFSCHRLLLRKFNSLFYHYSYYHYYNLFFFFFLILVFVFSFIFIIFFFYFCFCFYCFIMSFTYVVIIFIHLIFKHGSYESHSYGPIEGLTILTFQLFYITISFAGIKKE